jgi:hypothetical protein
VLALLICTRLAGCNLPTTPPTEGSALPEPSAEPTATETAGQGLPPTATEAPAPSPTEPEASPTQSEAACTDRASFVADVTYPDDSQVDPGAAFTKVWRLRNAGTCTWGSGYALAFSHGERMGGASPIAFTVDVSPGSTVDVAVALTAPSDPGTYQGYWMLRNPGGALFGIGAEGTTAFWVRVAVPAPAPSGSTLPPPLITGLPPMPFARATVSFDNVHGGCLMSGDYTTFRVENTGSIAFESYRIHIQFFDAPAGGAETSHSSGFLTSRFGCPPGESALAPGAVRYIAIGSARPSGQQARATVRLCTADGLGGTCIERTVDYTYP